MKVSKSGYLVFFGVSHLLAAILLLIMATWNVEMIVNTKTSIKQYRKLVRLQKNKLLH